MTYNIKWVGAHKNNYSTIPNSKVALVFHVAEGKIGAVDSWFNNPVSQASTHFCVGKEGQIHQYVSTVYSAYGNGLDYSNPEVFNHYNKNIAWLDMAIKNRMWLNSMTISIEREGYTKEPLTKAQYQALLWLGKKLAKDFNIPVDRDHFIGHSDIDNRNRPFCPGKNFDLDQFIKDVKALDEYKPNPENKKIGDGVMTKIIENKFVAVTDEQYLTNDHDLLKSSRTWVKDGTGKTFIIQAYQEPDATWQKFELLEFVRSL